jgi:hypothetical protein
MLGRKSYEAKGRLFTLTSSSTAQLMFKAARLIRLHRNEAGSALGGVEGVKL